MTEVAGRNEIVVHYTNRKGLRLGSGDIRMPGEAVPEAKNWKQNVFNANMKTNRIQLRSEYNHMKMVNEDKQKGAMLVNDNAHSNAGSIEDSGSDDVKGIGPEGSNENDNSDQKEVLAALNSLSVPKLRAKAKELGVTQQGKKGDLIKRISSAIIEKE